MARPLDEIYILFGGFFCYRTYPEPRHLLGSNNFNKYSYFKSEWKTFSAET